MARTYMHQICQGTTVTAAAVDVQLRYRYVPVGVLIGYMRYWQAHKQGILSACRLANGIQLRHS